MKPSEKAIKVAEAECWKYWRRSMPVVEYVSGVIAAAYEADDVVPRASLAAKDEALREAEKALREIINRDQRHGGTTSEDDWTVDGHFAEIAREAVTAIKNALEQ